MVKIYCEHLKKEIIASEDAYPNEKWGWLCDCGNWTKVAPNCHKIKR